jgi:dethiobiotin synthetase
MSCGVFTTVADTGAGKTVVASGLVRLAAGRALGPST